MALRNVREQGETILGKISKDVKEMNPRTVELIEDLLDTMYESNGVGLAAVQVGVLKRIFVVDVTGDEPHIFVNPRLLESSGEQSGHEGCISVPGKTGIVTRPNHVKVGAYDEKMEYFVLEADELLARAICHEFDHLDGHLYVERVEGRLMDIEEVEEEERKQKERRKRRQKRRHKIGA